MSPLEILSFLSARNASIQIFRLAEPYILDGERWSVRFEVEHKAAMLSTKSRAATMDEAILAAWSDLSPFLQH